ncbi:PdaC/SigV domain-containing protein [Gilvibacter sp.]|uniref:DUF3298 and DUF4163 domain-containing protein n=1 Tax=Gilvibacter sp. TaxID=2729997 RepID=UPI003F4A3A7C
MRLSFVLLALLILTGCSDQSNLNFVQKEVSPGALSLCNQSKCPEISVFYVEADPTDPRSAVINAQIEQELGEIISSAVMPGDSLIAEVQPALDAFVKSFQDYYGDFPEDALTYELELEHRVSFQNEDLISLSTVYYTYTGGAHGYGSESYLNLNPETGIAYSLPELIDDVDEFTAFAERQFRTQNGIALDANISSGQFLFDEDTFFLSETYGFNESGMVFYYPTYSIGSYADGPATLAFSWKQIGPWLNIPVPAL